MCSLGDAVSKDLKKVKCCASCEYSDPGYIGDTVGCTAYVNRQPKIYEVCESFYWDSDIREEMENEPR